MINLDTAFFSSSTAASGRAQPDGDFVALLARVADRQHPDGEHAGDLVSEATDVLDEEALEGAAAALALLAEESGASLDDDVVATGTALWLMHTALRAEYGDGPEVAAGEEGAGESSAAPVADGERVSLPYGEGALPADDDEVVAAGDEQAPAVPVEEAPAGAGEVPTNVRNTEDDAPDGTVAGPDETTPEAGNVDATTRAADDTDEDTLQRPRREVTSRTAEAGGQRRNSARVAEDATGNHPATDEGAERDEEAKRVEGAEARSVRGARAEATGIPEARTAAPTGERVIAEPAFATATEAATARAAEVNETATPRAPGASMVERILEAARRLENQPPPRQLTLELGEARVRLAIEDGALRVQLLGEQRAEDRELLRAAASELRARGFELGGDGPGRGREGRPETPDGPPARPGGHGPAGPGSRVASASSTTSTDLRL